MAASNSESHGTIDELLQQRARYEQWLSRLATAVDKAPSSVRDRVRGDYETRLAQVIDELRGHAATIAEELEEHRSTQRRLDDERRKAEEALAEAEVRHVVGEYSDDEWQRLRDRSERHLEGVRTELRAVGTEIDRLAEVQALIEAPVSDGQGLETDLVPLAPEPTSRPVVPVGPEPVLPLTMLTEPEPSSREIDVDEPAFPELQSEAEPEGTFPSALDELAFLQSVSDEVRKPELSPRQVNAAPAPKLADLEAPSPIVSTAPSAVSGGSGAGKTTGVAKTLKCNECGTFNRATEWYCERCGAELAAL